MSEDPTSRPLMMVAGEASGDLHGARLLQCLRESRPDLVAFGLGGDELCKVGLEAVADSREVSVVGLVEVLGVLRRARQIFQELLAEVDRRKPAVAVLVDFSGFNLRLARQLHRRGVRVIYYVSPQVWAWRRGRVRTIAQVVDRMLVLFPFEVDFYRRHGVDALHVGHPLVDEVPRLPNTGDTEVDREGPFRIALLPGSRDGEVRTLLPVMLDSVTELARRHTVHPVLVLAPSVDREMVMKILAESELDVEVEERDRFAAVASSYLALCASGTATLEVGLLGTPMIVMYKIGRITATLARPLIRVPHIALVNLVLGERVVPEIVQGDLRADRVAAEAESLLENPERAREMRLRLGDLWEALGEGGASRRAAAEVERYLAAEEEGGSGP